MFTVKKIVAMTAGAAALAIGCGSATAASSLSVQSVVPNSCAISAITPVSEGNYDPITSNADKTGTATFKLKCTKNLTGIKVALSPGQSGDASARYLQVGGTGDELPYSLTQDSAHMVNWGDTPASQYSAPTGTGLDQTITIYYIIPGGQNIQAGTYTDTVSISATF